MKVVNLSQISNNRQYNRDILVGVAGDIWCSNHPRYSSYKLLNSIFKLDNSQYRRLEYIRAPDLPEIRYVIGIISDSIFLMTKNSILSISERGTVRTIDNVIDAVNISGDIYYLTTDHQLNQLSIFVDRWSITSDKITELAIDYIDDNVESIHLLILRGNSPEGDMDKLETVLLVRYGDRNAIGRFSNNKLQFTTNLDLGDIVRVDLNYLVNTDGIITLTISNNYMLLPTGMGLMIHDLINSRIVVEIVKLDSSVADVEVINEGAVELIDDRIIDRDNNELVIGVKRFIKFIDQRVVVNTSIIEGLDNKIYTLNLNTRQIIDLNIPVQLL